MKKITRAAVVGVGYLGRFHAQKYKALPNCTLEGLYDIDSARVEEVAGELGVPGFTSLEELLERVDALSIAVSTPAHYQVALRCLKAGKHILIEKPIAARLDEAEELVELSHRQGVLMQVGYLERFNPAFLACKDQITRPQFIEAIRIASFLERGTDVDVVLDLMTHDLDLVLALSPSPLKDLHAVGKSLMTDSTDLANARLIFEDGCVANITTSRISHKVERKLRVFQHDSYFSMDFAKPSARIFRKNPDSAVPNDFTEKMHELEKGDSLMAEIISFVDAVQGRSPPAVSGDEGLRAMKAADRVMQDIARNRLP